MIASIAALADPSTLEPALTLVHLADLKAYADPHSRLEEFYADPHAWSSKAVLNVAGAGKFSSDRTIAEYAREIWGAEPCPIPSLLRAAAMEPRGIDARS